MGRREDPALERMETRLVRLAQADEELGLLLFRLGQISRRAPSLHMLVDAACSNAARALAQVREEFEDTRAERAR